MAPGARRVALWIALMLCAHGAGMAAPATAASDDEAEAEVDAAAERAADARRRVLAAERNLETRRVGLVRLRLGHPQRLSLGLGVLRTRQPADFDCRTLCDHRGPLVQLEPGVAGMRLSAGWARLIAERRNDPRFLSSVFVGVGVKGVVLRTWDRSTLDPRQQTLVGVEGDFTITSVNFSLGLLRRVSPDSGPHPWIISGGLGWGF